MLMARALVCFGVVLTAGVSVRPAFAQFEGAAILGTVRDSTGGTVENTKITLQNVNTGVQQTTTTDGSGEYVFQSVRIGIYKVLGEATGFKAAEAQEFTVTVGARQRVDLTLQVGEVSDKVVVVDAATPLETDTSSRGTVVTTQNIVNLPLNGRSYADLALLAPGVRKSNLANSTSPRDASFNVNGMRSSQNNFVLDGVDNNAYGTSNQGFSNQVVQPAPDAVQEFRLETNNFSAEYGRAGGAIINATIRSGTNEFHGSAWEFLRNTSLNATGFFKPVNNQKPVLIRNQFGGAFGGPIVKDKLFFFADYEGFRQTQSGIFFSDIPTVEQRQGNLGIPVRNPYTGEVYANGIIPQSEITPFARQVLNDLPAPNRPGNAANLQTQPKQTNQYDKGDIRSDYYLNTRLSLFGRYSHRLVNNFEPGVIPGPSGGNNNGNVRILNQAGVFGTNLTLSSTSLLETRLSVTYTEGGKTPIGVGTPGVAQTFGFPNLPTDERFVGGLYPQGINGYTALGVQGSNPQFQNPYVLNPKVNYSKILSRHSLKAGYEYQAIDTDIDDFNPKSGSDSYSGRFSQVPGTPNNNLQFLADFLFGARSSYQLNNSVILNYRQRMHFAYLQDDWKVNSKLTLNLGVRYEFASPQWEGQNRLANFDPTTNTTIPARDGSLYDRSGVKPDYNNWAPRVGVAYTLTPKTVLRSAYGISYLNFNRLGGENLLGYNLPTVLNPIVDQVAPAATNGQRLCTSVNDPAQGCFRPTQLGYPNNFLSLSNVNQALVRTNYIPQDNPTGYVQMWHFTVQRELMRDFVLDVGYVGTRGVNLMILGDYNQARPNSSSAENLPLQQRRPIQNFGFIQAAFGAGFLNYHALQVKLEKRFSGGLYFLHSFTWSKAIDNASGHLETSNGDNSRVNIRNLPAERGLSGYDQPFTNITTVNYEIPFGRGRKFGSDMNRFLDTAIGGWRVVAINTVTSGQPVNLTYNPSAQLSVSGAPTYRANITGDPLVPESSRTVQNWLNRDTVQLPTDPRFPFGNAGRNIVRGPDFFTLDLGLHKQFRIWESHALEFRAEAFNTTNRTNFNPPNSNRSAGAFGQLQSTLPARQVQFALKYLF
ncbi:MAG: TonB-dependent receptor [Bryobacteraceae bacterium]|nr:TonB-dependent receptor [Bryobacteraceae bacterium]